MAHESTAHHATRAPHSLAVDLLVILGGGAVLTAISMLLDLDRRTARLVLEPGSWLGGAAESAATASVAISAIALVVLVVPALRRRWPLAARCGAVFAGTLLIAVLALVENVKNEIHRPRPDETEGFGGELPYRHPFGSEPTCSCKSFPSRTAGFACLLATPYFVLRRWPVFAAAVLGVGLAWAALLGYGRMVAGRHWLTDVIWAAAAVLAIASVLSHLTIGWRSVDEPP